ncbi:unnamed protein product [Arabidopsis halleri]
MSAEILKKRGIYDPNKLFGLMTPEIELAKALTTLPLFSKTKPQPPEILTKQERRLWSEDVEMFVPFESQSIAFYVPESFEKYEVRGAELFLLCAHDGAEDIFQCCFVQSKITDVPASTVKLGKNGVEAFIKTYLKGLTYI